MDWILEGSTFEDSVLDHVKLSKVFWPLFFCNHVSTIFLGFNFGDYFDQFVGFFLAAIFLTSILF